jgi:hypothetical protein
MNSIWYDIARSMAHAVYSIRMYVQMYSVSIYLQCMCLCRYPHLCTSHGRCQLQNRKRQLNKHIMYNITTSLRQAGP